MIEEFLIKNINQLTVGALALAFLMLVWRYFTNKEQDMATYIKALVADSQKNTENFVNTINHNQTKVNQSMDNLSKTQIHMNNAIEKLAHSIDDQTDVFKELIRK